HDGVPVVRRGDVDSVDVGTGQQLAEVVVDLAVTVVVMLVYVFLGFLPDLFAHVAEGHVLHVLAVEKCPHVAAAHVADADASHDDPVTRWRPVGVGPGAGSEDVRRRGERTGGLQKIAASRLLLIAHGEKTPGRKEREPAYSNHSAAEIS